LRRGKAHYETDAMLNAAAAGFEKGTDGIILSPCLEPVYDLSFLQEVMAIAGI
jgi:hypothetical protein